MRFQAIGLTILTFLTIVSCGKTETIQYLESIESLTGETLPVSDLNYFLEQKMADLDLPGISIAIINDSELVYHKTAGVSNVDTGEPVTDRTLFDAGSLTKPLFAFFVLKMIDQSLLDLDTPLYTYLPNPDIAYDERYKLITARMVLSHTSGFPNWRFQNDDGRLDFKFTPGTQFNYSGEGFEYLAEVIAHLNGVEKNDLQEIMERSVFQPLEMNQSFMVWNDIVAEHQASGHFNGEVADGWGINPDEPDFQAAYSLQTEAVDYARFLTALLNETELSEELTKEMFTAQISTPDRTTGTAWGLGIEIDENTFGNIYRHGGDNRTFTSGFVIARQSGNGYVFFTNGNKGHELNLSLEEFLTE